MSSYKIAQLLAFPLVLGSIILPTMAAQRSFIVDKEKNCFLKEGKPFKYISGSMHYFRVPKCYWDDRLKKIRAAGLNVVERYFFIYLYDIYVVCNH